MNLYKLENRLREWYVLAKDPTEAEAKLMKLLLNNDYGLYAHRKVVVITFMGTTPKGGEINSDTNVIL